MVKKLKKPLGQMLVDSGILTPDQLSAALEHQQEAGIYLGKALLDLKFVSEEVLFKFLSEQLEIPMIQLNSFQVSKESIELISDTIARKYMVLPLFELNGVLNVAISDPLDPSTLDIIARETRMEVEPIICTPTEIENSIDVYYGMSKMIGGLDTTLLGAGKDQAAGGELTDETRIVDMVDGLITQAVKYKASDIHIEPRENDVRIRFRIDGQLREFFNPSKKIHLPLISRIKIMSELDIAETRKPQDGRIHVVSNGSRIDLRISTYPTYYGEKVVMRVLDVENAKLQLEDLGFDPKVKKVYESLASAGEGIILVSGPTGSGKTTTLYATLNKINVPTRNIVTIEDPVEYELANINQAQVNAKAGMTFALALRAILRQDPDIIMIGEIRDEETVDLAVRAALTGHLVFSTIHTNDAATGFTRLANWGVEPFLITSTVKAIIAQRLVRKLCVKCRQPYTPDSGLIQRIGLEKDKKYTFYKPMGCLSCRNVGYKGRMGIFELLVMNETISDLVEKNTSAHAIKRAAVKDGMVTIRRDGIKKIIRGDTSIDEVISGLAVGFSEVE